MPAGRPFLDNTTPFAAGRAWAAGASVRVVVRAHAHRATCSVCVCVICVSFSIVCSARSQALCRVMLLPHHHHPHCAPFHHPWLQR